MLSPSSNTQHLCLPTFPIFDTTFEGVAMISKCYDIVSFTIWKNSVYKSSRKWPKIIVMLELFSAQRMWEKERKKEAERIMAFLSG